MITFDDLFAYRLQYQDISMDEYYIIKKLKSILMNDQDIDNNDINKYIFDFYEHFGFSLSLEEIEQVATYSNNNYLNSFANFTNDQYENIINNYPLNPINENAEDDNYASNEDDNTSQSNDDNISQSNDDNTSQSNDDTYHSNPPSIANENSNNLSSLLNIPIIMNNFPNNNENINIIPPVNINNTLNNNILNNNIPLPQVHPNVNFDIVYTFGGNNINGNQNLFNQLLNTITQQIEPDEQDDVVMTLDKKDFDNLNVDKYEYGDDNCSICLDKLEKDNEFYNLKCNHFFHKDCLDKWLKEYNYICPICRCEIGKSKPKEDINIENNNIENNNIENNIESNTNV